MLKTWAASHGFDNRAAIWGHYAAFFFLAARFLST
jgi:hypothetical protein